MSKKNYLLEINWITFFNTKTTKKNTIIWILGRIATDTVHMLRHSLLQEPPPQMIRDHKSKYKLLEKKCSLCDKVAHVENKRHIRCFCTNGCYSLSYVGFSNITVCNKFFLAYSVLTTTALTATPVQFFKY